MGVLLCPAVLAQKEKPETEEPAEDPPVKIGVADGRRVGTLPAMTTQISKRAAKAFLQGDWPQARDAYLEILRSDPNNALALTNLGATYLQMEKFDKATSTLEKALVQQPGLHQARVTLGIAYLENGAHYRAISTLSRAVADQPKDAHAHNYLAVAARELGWIDAALRELQAAVAADPKFAEAHYNLALVYMEQRPPAHELARRHYHRAIDLGATPDAALVKRIDAAGP